MNLLEQALRRVREDLQDLGVRWALVGGLAVSALTEPRFTRDVDLAVAADGDEESEALVRQLTVRGYEVLGAVEQLATGRLATVRLIPPGLEAGTVVVDLLFASSGIENEAVSSAEEIELMNGLFVPVCSLAHLLVMKVLSQDDENRPQDAVDVRSILRESDAEVIQSALRAAALVEERGFNRGRALREQIRALAAEHSKGSD